MEKLLVIALVTAITIVSLTACGSSGPSVSACKSAMKAEYARALSSGAQGTGSAACKGLPVSELQKLAAQILEGH